jgi:uncharacterized protein (TIGR03435 family)
MLVRIAVGSLLFAGLLAGQLSFEVASVKPNNSGSRSTITRTGEDFLILLNWPLREIVLKAYKIEDYSLSAPDWLASQNFDINAKAAQKATDAEVRTMLQSLLVERFQLRVHSETREMQGFALLPAKGGFRIKPSGEGRCDVDMFRGSQRTRIDVRQCSMDSLASVLSGQVRRPVVNQSEIAGTYSFALEWSPNQNAEDVGPSIFTALSEQLGLRLESHRLRVPILVVDGINRTPVEN